MNTNNIQNPTFVSSITNTTVGGSPTDLMAYVEMLLVQDYDEQMKDMANSIKTNNRLKQAYREHKINVNNLLNKEQKDGKVKLTAQEYELLNTKPDFMWDQATNDGSGGVQGYNSDGEPISAISNNAYIEASYNGTNTPVAAGQTASWWGDPHFIDADGGTWDFQGKDGETYAYMNESNFYMLATHKGRENGTTVVGEVNIILNGPEGASNIVFNADGSPTINDEAMTVGQVYTTADGGTAVYDGKTLTVTTAEGYVAVLKDEGDRLDGQVTAPSKGTESDGIAAQGVLGSTFDADTNASYTDNSTAESVNSAQFKANNAAGQTNTGSQTYKVNVDQIKAEVERLQMRLDGLNSNTEMSQTELSTLTSQRKLAFETLSTMISKVFEGASTVVRNIK